MNGDQFTPFNILAIFPSSGPLLMHKLTKRIVTKLQAKSICPDLLSNNSKVRSESSTTKL